MKFLFRSGWGESLAVARQVESEGNLVRLSIVEPTAKHVGDGLITKATDFVGSASWADVVVFDSNPFNMSDEAQRLIDGHKYVVGSSALSGKLEHDRVAAIELAKRCGIEVPYYFRFRGKGAWQKARQYLSEHGDEDDDGWVWKHCGDSEVASTFVGSTAEMLRMLTYFELLYRRAKEVPDFILTTKIKGVEVSTEAWFNGSEFVLANNTIEKNRFFNGDLGEKTGCAGNVVWAYGEVEECPLYGKLLEPLVSSLMGQYCGPVDVNALIDEESGEPTFLEFTPRFGYDAIFALSRLITSDVGGLLADMAHHRTWNGKFNTEAFSGAIRLTTPPYPEEEPNRAEDIPIFGFEAEKVDKAVSPCEVKLDPFGLPITSGPNGYVFVLSALGETVEEAITNATEITEKLTIPLMRYRTDLASTLDKCYNELARTGYTRREPARRLFGRRS